MLTPQTKFVLLTNLHNPSGAHISQSFLSDVVQSAKEKCISVVIDEIYLEFLEEEPGAFPNRIRRRLECLDERVGQYT